MPRPSLRLPFITTVVVSSAALHACGDSVIDNGDGRAEEDRVGEQGATRGPGGGGGSSATSGSGANPPAPDWPADKPVDGSACETWDFGGSYECGPYPANEPCPELD